MFKMVIASVCGMSLAGSVYLSGWGGNCGGSACDDGSCCSTPSSSVVGMAQPDAAALANAVDVKNTKCIVSGGDPMGEGASLVYNGKLYHFCCENCVPEFKKDPEKYIKALEADPAKFGVKK